MTDADFGPLATVDWLAAHGNDADLRIADCRWYLGEPDRGPAAYVAGHIAGAVYVDLDRHLSAASGPGRHPLPSPTEFASGMGSLGIGDGSTVVAYDDRGGAVASRLWWMLRWIGHPRVAVLDGGLTAWEASGRRLTPETAAPEAAQLTVETEAMPTVDRDRLLASLGDAVVVDARAGERYRGETEPIDPVAGHIPGAISAPLSDNLGDDDRFLDPEVLRDRYRSLGVERAAGTIVYCGSGVTACHDLLAMEVAGLGRATLYPGSWSDWSTAGLRAATGEEPG